MGKRHQPEEIIGKLREAEIVVAQGGTKAVHVGGSRLPSRAITAGARNGAAWRGGWRIWRRRTFGSGGWSPTWRSTSRRYTGKPPRSTVTTGRSRCRAMATAVGQGTSGYICAMIVQAVTWGSLPWPGRPWSALRRRSARDQQQSGGKCTA